MKATAFYLIILLTSAVFSQEIEFKAIDSKTNASFRALSVVDDLVMWVSGSNGWYGRSKDGGETWEFDQHKLLQEVDFRTLYAFDFNNAVIANAGSPAYILRTSDGGQNWMPVYQNSDPKIFLDGIDFWDRQQGIIYGDPIDGRMTILMTFDGGFTWGHVNQNMQPEMEEGETSFAASGTNIRCFDEKNVIIASGGKKSRLHLSDNKCNTWKTIDVPILQGEESTGIFSLAINKNGHIVVVGGDYLKEDQTIDHVFRTENMGNKWKEPAQKTLGYRECVEYLDENSLITVGPNGTEISNDNGNSWTSVQGSEGMHVVRKARNGTVIISAGRSGRMFIIR